MLNPNDPIFAELATPALVVDGAVLRQNIEDMATRGRAASIALRPHAKTHKSVDIARLQLQAGAAGIACATLAEAEAFTAAGLRGILVTSPFMGDGKFARAARLAREAEVAFVVDHPAQLEGFGTALRAGDPPLRLVVDCDIGHARTGVVDPASTVALAHAIASDTRFRFEGVQGFAGHAQHVLDGDERKTAAAQAAERLAATVKALMQAGLPPTLVSGSGTGTYALDARGPYNELQVGSYIFMDADYARLRGADAPAFPPALFVLATVMSANRPGQVTVDAGTKALATNGPLPTVLLDVGGGANYTFAGDEHGLITLPAGEAAPKLGARVLIGATHCDPTVNLHAAFHVVQDGALHRWPVLGRYGDTSLSPHKGRGERRAGE